MEDRFGGEVLGLFLARRGEGPVTTATVVEETGVNEVGGVAEPAHPLLVPARTLQDESAGAVVADSAEMFVDGEGGCGSAQDLQEDMILGRGRPTGGEQLVVLQLGDHQEDLAAATLDNAAGALVQGDVVVASSSTPGDGMDVVGENDVNANQCCRDGVCSRWRSRKWWQRC